MRYLSVCSGIEAASVAFGPLGWEPLAFSEIEAFPRAVLAHHYPDTPCHGDFTELKDQPFIVDADLLCGGTPCQAFSVAGLRQSLADDRGNLSLQFIHLADAIDDLRRAAGKSPAWILWENVPGVLNTSDNAFGAFLGGLCGRDAAIPQPADGWTRAGVVDGPTRCVAWRILDAQHFGLAQRRQRVFVLALGGAGRWAAADALLPLIESGDWHPAPSRASRQGIAPTISARTSGGGGLGTDFDLDGGLIPETTGCITTKYGAQAGQDMGADGMLIPSAPDIAHTLRGEGFDASEDGPGRGVPMVVHPELAPCVTSKWAKGTGGPSGSECGNLDEVAAPMLVRMREGKEGGGKGPLVSEDKSLTLATANDQVLAYGSAQHTTGHQGDRVVGDGDVHPSLSAQGGNNGGGSGALVQRAASMQVRRLTPRECERLQGFPDDYTLIPLPLKSRQTRVRWSADGPRYKALGNSWAVPCARYIGERIKALTTP